MNGMDNEVYEVIWKYLARSVLWSHEKADLKSNGVINLECHHALSSLLKTFNVKKKKIKSHCLVRELF